MPLQVAAVDGWMEEKRSSVALEERNEGGMGCDGPRVSTCHPHTNLPCSTLSWMLPLLVSFCISSPSPPCFLSSPPLSKAHSSHSSSSRLDGDAHFQGTLWRPSVLRGFVAEFSDSDTQYLRSIIFFSQIVFVTFIVFSVL